MNFSDTIVAVATGSAPSPRSLVRASGSGALVLLDAVARARSEDRGSVYTAEVRLAIGPLPLVAIRYSGPRSYTGEDAFEILLPGSPPLVRAVLDLLLSFDGVRLALPGEFSARALLAGKLTIAQAEGVTRVISARNEAELRVARRSLAGEVGEQCARIAEDITTSLALTEAGIDFTDQEGVVAITPDRLREVARDCIETIDTMIGGSTTREASSDLPSVVLVGRPNAGKSTLFNALLGRTRVVASPTPGSTVDAITERLDAAGCPVMLTDLAGLVESSQAAPMHAARRAIERADVIVLCDPDARFDLLLPDHDAAVIRVRTKSDLARDDANAEAPSQQSNGAIAICALEGGNLSTLRAAIRDAAMSHDCAGSLASPRQRADLTTARAALTALAHDASTPELSAHHLRTALQALGGMTGHVGIEEVLGRIFSTFCVGK